jgi:hypothetical protein
MRPGLPYAVLAEHYKGKSDGRGWVRTSDLSRVRRALSH